jgi:hypothetical protein
MVPRQMSELKHRPPRPVLEPLSSATSHIHFLATGLPLAPKDEAKAGLLPKRSVGDT